MKPLKGYLTRNWPLKLLAVLIATVVWIYGVWKDSQTLVRTAQVKIIIPEDLTVLRQSHPEVELTLIGPSAPIESVRRQPELLIRCDLKQEGYDLRGGGVRALAIAIHEQQLDLPASVRIQDCRPAKIRVTLDRLIQKKLPIVPKLIYFTGENGSAAEKKAIEPPFKGRTEGLAKGYVIYDVTVSTPEVMVKGPASVLEQPKAALTTSPFILKNHAKSIYPPLEVLPQLSHPELGDVPVELATPDEKGTVTVSIEIIQEQGARTLQVKLLLLNRLKTALPIRVVDQDDKPVTELTVSITGPREQVAKLDPETVKVWVDVTPYKAEGIYPVKPNVSPPPGIERDEGVRLPELKVIVGHPKPAVKGSEG
jgi:hypothetical protein